MTGLEKSHVPGSSDAAPSRTPPPSAASSIGPPIVPGGQPIVEVADLEVRFGGVVALAGVSFALTSGRCCGLIGANGSGKSTLLAALSRLNHGVERGEIRLAGESCVGWPPDRVARWGVARTFQTVRLVADLDIQDNVMAGVMPGSAPGFRVGRRGGVLAAFRSGADAAARVEQALQTVGVSAYRRRRPNELPYGLQRRVEIARAIVSGPRVLLLDEPTAGMTGRERAELGDLFRQLALSGIAVLVVEHDVRFVTTNCDQAFALDGGRVIARGTPAEVIASPEVRQAYLGTSAARGSEAPGSRHGPGAADSRGGTPI